MKLHFKETKADELNAGFWTGVGIGVIVGSGLIVLT